MSPAPAPETLEPATRVPHPVPGPASPAVDVEGELGRIRRSAATQPPVETPAAADGPPAPPVGGPEGAQHLGRREGGSAPPVPSEHDVAVPASPPPSPPPSPAPPGTTSPPGYEHERACHDSWSRIGIGGEPVAIDPVEMDVGDRFALVGEAVGIGALQGLGGAASAVALDTGISFLSRNVPYAAGFLALAEVTYQGPEKWWDAKWDSTGGSIERGLGTLFSTDLDVDWMDRIEAVVDVMSGLSATIGLLSTICFVVAALGLVASVAFPALLPFVALAAKWGVLLSKIGTVVGLIVTALRLFALACRTIQMLCSDADPSVQARRAGKLREMTAAFTQEAGTRAGSRLAQKGIGSMRRPADDVLRAPAEAPATAPAAAPTRSDRLMGVLSVAAGGTYAGGLGSAGDISTSWAETKALGNAVGTARSGIGTPEDRLAAADIVAAELPEAVRDRYSAGIENDAMVNSVMIDDAEGLARIDAHESSRQEASTRREDSIEERFQQAVFRDRSGRFVDAFGEDDTYGGELSGTDGHGSDLVGGWIEEGSWASATGPAAARDRWVAEQRRRALGRRRGVQDAGATGAGGGVGADVRRAVQERCASLAASLPSPPVEAEEAVIEGSADLRSLDVEEREIADHAGDATVLRGHAAHEVDKLGWIGEAAAQHRAGIAAERAELDTRRAAQRRMREQVAAEGRQAGAAGGARRRENGGLQDLVRGIVELTGLVPSEVVGNAADGRAAAGQLGGAFDDVGDLTGESGGRASEELVAIAEAEAETAATGESLDVADAELIEVQQSAAEGRDQAGAGVVGFDAAHEDATTRIQEIAVLRAEARQRRDDALAEMGRWAGQHEGIRTVGEAELEALVDSWSGADRDAGWSVDEDAGHDA